MRLQFETSSEIIFKLSIENVTIGDINVENVIIDISLDMLIDISRNFVVDIVNNTYSLLLENLRPFFFHHWVNLAQTNDIFCEFKEYIMSFIHGEA